MVLPFTLCMQASINANLLPVILLLEIENFLAVKLESFLADVFAVLSALPLDFINRLVSFFNRLLNSAA